MKQSHLRNTLSLHVYFFLTKEVSIRTSMLFKSGINWWDRDCFLTIFSFYFSFYIPVSSKEFSNSGTAFFTIIVWPHHFPLYPKRLCSSCLLQQKYYPLLSQHAWNSWAPNFNKTHLSKTCSNSLFPTNPALLIEATDKLLSKPSPFHMPLDSLSNWLCGIPLVNVSFLAAASFLSLVQQLIWQLIFRFRSALPQQNPEDDELMGEGIRFSSWTLWLRMYGHCLCCVTRNLNYNLYCSEGCQKTKKFQKNEKTEAHKPDRSILDVFCCFFPEHTS